jgi:hypothetical protein
MKFQSYCIEKPQMQSKEYIKTLIESSQPIGLVNGSFGQTKIKIKIMNEDL